MVDELVYARLLVLVGFSRGVAMAYRAASVRELAAAGLVALAGDLPPEIAEGDLSRFPPALIARGDGEEWYAADKSGADAKQLHQDGVTVEEFEFAGGHEWTDEVRRAIAEFVGGG